MGYAGGGGMQVGGGQLWTTLLREPAGLRRVAIGGGSGGDEVLYLL